MVNLKLGKKSGIIAASILVVAVSSSVTFAALANNVQKQEPKASQVEPPKNVEQKSADETQPSAASQDTTSSQPIQNTVTAPTPAPQPTYGADPSNPGVYKVFDVVSVMDAAGIAPSDRDALQKLITNWIYNSDSNQEVNLCNATPKRKMASMGDDFATNPITQLKWCNGFVISRYSTWQNAYDHFLQQHTY